MAEIKNLIVTSLEDTHDKVFIRIGDISPLSTSTNSSAIQFLQDANRSFSTATTTSAFRFRHDSINKKFYIQSSDVSSNIHQVLTIGQQGYIEISPSLMIYGDDNSYLDIKSNNSSINISSNIKSNINYKGGSVLYKTSVYYDENTSRGVFDLNFDDNNLIKINNHQRIKTTFDINSEKDRGLILSSFSRQIKGGTNTGQGNTIQRLLTLKGETKIDDMLMESQPQMLFYDKHSQSKYYDSRNYAIRLKYSDGDYPSSSLVFGNYNPQLDWNSFTTSAIFTHNKIEFKHDVYLTNHNSNYVLTTDASGKIYSSNKLVSAIGSGGTGGPTYVAGNGINIDVNDNISVDLTPISGLQFNSGKLGVKINQTPGVDNLLILGSNGLLVNGANLVTPTNLNSTLLKYLGNTNSSYMGTLNFTGTTQKIEGESLIINANKVNTGQGVGFYGKGSNLTNLNAGNISTGILSIARGGTGRSSFTQTDRSKLLQLSANGSTIQATGTSITTLTSNISTNATNIALNTNTISSHQNSIDSNKAGILEVYGSASSNLSLINNLGSNLNSLNTNTLKKNLSNTTTQSFLGSISGRTLQAFVVNTPNLTIDENNHLTSKCTFTRKLINQRDVVLYCQQGDVGYINIDYILHNYINNSFRGGTIMVIYDTITGQLDFTQTSTGDINGATMYDIYINYDEIKNTIQLLAPDCIVNCLIREFKL